VRRQLQRHAQRLAHGQRPAPQPLDERFPLHQFHDDEQGAVVFTNVVGRGHRGRSQHGRRLGFLEKSGPAVRIPVVRRVDELERHGATESGIPTSIHLAHAPAAEAVVDLVVLDDATGGGHTRSCAAAASVVAVAGVRVERAISMVSRV